MSRPILHIHLEGDGCWPDLGDKIIHETSEIEAALLIGGMSRGRPSVAFRIDLPNDKVVIAQTSLDLLRNAVAAFDAKMSMVPPPADA